MDGGNGTPQGARPLAPGLDLGNNSYWQIMGGMDLDVAGGGSLFNWDQSLDFITGNLGTENVMGGL